MPQLNRTVRPTKKSGRCQTRRVRPVSSMILTTIQAAINPANPIGTIQGTRRSRKSNSGRLNWAVRNSICLSRTGRFTLLQFYHQRFYTQLTVNRTTRRLGPIPGRQVRPPSAPDTTPRDFSLPSDIPMYRLCWCIRQKLGDPLSVTIRLFADSLFYLSLNSSYRL
jgi:hypothetical protein